MRRIPSLLLSLVAGLALYAATDARAQEPDAAPAAPDEETDDGLGTYLAAGFVWGHEQFNDVGTRDVDDSPGFSAWIGQKLAPWAGVEIQWEWIDQFDVKNLGAYGSNGHVEVNHLTLNGRLHPLAGRAGAIARVVQPFVKAGAGFGYMEIDDTYGKLTDAATFVVRGGLGIDWMLSNRFAVVTGADYVYPFSRIDGIRTSYISATVGFQYRFAARMGP